MDKRSIGGQSALRHYRSYVGAALLCILIFNVSQTSGQDEKQWRTVIVDHSLFRRAPNKQAPVLSSPQRGSIFPTEGEINGYYIVNLHNHKIPVLYVAKWMMSSQTIPIINHRLYPPLPPSSRSTYRLSGAADYINRVSFTDTKATWYKVEGSGGYIHFKDAAFTQGRFSADLAIDGADFKPTTKPIEVDFAVTLYDASGNVVARDSVSVSNISDFGGEYTLLGDYVTTDNPPVSCSIKYSSAWTSRK